MHNDAATLRILEEVSAVTLFQCLTAKWHLSLMPEFTSVDSGFTTINLALCPVCTFADALTC